MIKILLIILMLSLLNISNNALAIEGGTPLNWVEHDDMVHMSCTGTIISGKWILTAAHCEPAANQGVKTLHNGTLTANIYNHPENLTGGVDIALWELPAFADTTTTTFLSMRNVGPDEAIKISGFGQTAPNLNYAIQISKTQQIGLAARRLFLELDNKGKVLPGDSGSPMTDNTNSIIGILATGGEGVGATGTRLHFARDFILERINGWHYPTQVITPTTGGTVTIEVQSLHQNDFMDNATYSGDVTVTGGSCSGATIEPFENCTYVIESSEGYEGVVTLDVGQTIVVNKGRKKPTPPPPPTPGGESSGGSIHFLALLALLGFQSLRRKPL